MPRENEIAIYVGTFDAKKNKEVWKKDSVHKTLKEGYIVFKELCKKIAGYTYEELIDVYNTPRLDIELMQGDDLIKWFGIYEKPIEEPEEKEE